jgi:hypothetical protein
MKDHCTNSLVTRFTRLIPVGLALVASCVTLPVYAIDEDARVLQDVLGRLFSATTDGFVAPEFPKTDNLRQIQRPEGVRGWRYYVDDRSIVTSRDGVVYYTIVIRSSTNVNNVWHEGLDCHGRLGRTLAVGTAKGTFHSLSGTKWRRFATSGPTAYRYVLFDRYLCAESSAAFQPDEVVARLNDPSRTDDRAGAPSDAGNND